MRFLVHPVARVLLAVAVILAVICGGVFIHYYNRYAHIIDLRLSSKLFDTPAILYAAPQTVFVGETLTPQDIALRLMRAHYNDPKFQIGTYKLGENEIRINPGVASFHSPEPALVAFSKGSIASIQATDTGQQLSSYELEPEQLTTMFDRNRSKRRILSYAQIPPHMVQAVLAIEDREYFHHGAINYWRILAAAYRDLRSNRKEQGGSTITMQVARNFFLTPQKSIRRKLTEMLIAFELEQRLTKQQIFELYANKIYMGQSGTYTIRGFGQASQAYFDKPLQQLDWAQYALLAGIIHSPNGDNPDRHPNRALERRNQVLHNIYKAGWMGKADEQSAMNEPLNVVPPSAQGSEAPYFVDVLREQIAGRIPAEELESRNLHVFTTLDPDLQRIAARAVADGMALVDKRITAMRTRVIRRHGRIVGHRVLPGPMPQAALIALDPHTGAVKALVGGTNYAASQLNHVLAIRPTGSIFKPIVYATALSSVINGTQPQFVPTSTVMDEPTTFEGGYQPGNFENIYMGRVTLRTALMHSLNNATISLAQQVGYQRVADLAHEAGLTQIQATPAEAIGSYGATPLQMAQAYTMFANHGILLKPQLFYSIQTASGDVIMRGHNDPKPLLDPRIAFLTTSLMESVINNGTAAGVRGMGFDAPAAGKTGTSHDGWFAGYTNNLLCIVWVGFDDYRQLGLEGAHSALPIWGEFMKNAIQLPAYHDVHQFNPPPGIVAVQLDPQTLQLATPLCPKTVTEYYVAGTQPTQYCQLHSPPLTAKGVGNKVLNFLHLGGSTPPPPPSQPDLGAPGTPQAVAQNTPSPPKKKKKKKKGFFSRIF